MYTNEDMPALCICLNYMQLCVVHGIHMYAYIYIYIYIRSILYILGMMSLSELGVTKIQYCVALCLTCIYICIYIHIYAHVCVYACICRYKLCIYYLCFCLFFQHCLNIYRYVSYYIHAYMCNILAVSV